MKVKTRELEYERWQWDEKGGEVTSSRNKESHGFKWEDVTGVGRLGLKLSNGRTFVVRGNNDEVHQLKRELREDWKSHNPCGWVDATKKGTKKMRLVFGIILPSLPILIFIIPSGGLAAFHLITGDANPELVSQYYRRIVFGVVILAAFLGVYFTVMRKEIRRLQIEIDGIIQRQNTAEQTSAPNP